MYVQLCLLRKAKAKLLLLLIVSRGSAEVLPGRVRQKGLEHVHRLGPLPVLKMIISQDNDDDCNLVKQCEGYGVSERPLQDAVVLSCYHLLVTMHFNDGHDDDDEEGEDDETLM